jgi:hypothetical protein
LILKLRKSDNTAFAATTVLKNKAAYTDAAGPTDQWDVQDAKYEDLTKKSMQVRVIGKAPPAGSSGIGSITVSISETGGTGPFTPSTALAVDKSIFPLCPVPTAGQPPYGGKGLPYAGELDAAPPPEEQGVAVPLQGD